MPRMMVSTLALFAWTCSSQNQSGSVRLELGTWLQGRDESLPCSRRGGLLPPPTQDSAGWEQARDGEESTLEFGSISWLHSHLLRDCGVTRGSVREPLLLTSSAGGAVEMSGVKCSASGMPRLTNPLQKENFFQFLETATVSGTLSDMTALPSHSPSGAGSHLTLSLNAAASGKPLRPPDRAACCRGPPLGQPLL